MPQNIKLAQELHSPNTKCPRGQKEKQQRMQTEWWCVFFYLLESCSFSQVSKHTSNSLQSQRRIVEFQQQISIGAKDWDIVTHIWYNLRETHTTNTHERLEKREEVDKLPHIQFCYAIQFDYYLQSNSYARIIAQLGWLELHFQLATDYVQTIEWCDSF